MYLVSGAFICKFKLSRQLDAESKAVLHMLMC